MSTYFINTLVGAESLVCFLFGLDCVVFVMILGFAVFRVRFSSSVFLVLDLMLSISGKMRIDIDKLDLTAET